MDAWTSAKNIFLIVVVVWASLLFNPQFRMASAQETATANPAEVATPSQITTEQVEAALAELDQNGKIAADAKLQAIENYQAAIKNVQTASEHDARLKALIADAESVTARTQQLNTERNEVKDKKPAVESGLGLQALEQLLPTAELQLSGYKKARQDAESEKESRSPRRKEIRARLVVIQERVADASSQLATLASAETSPQSQSLVARLLTRKMTLEKEKPALEAELSKFDAEEAADLVRMRMEVAGSNATYTEKLIALLQQKINAAREAAAEESVRAARHEAINADPALKVYAENNQELAESAKKVAESLAETESKLKASTGIFNDLLRQFGQTKKKVDSVGLSSSIGALLRKQLAALPDIASRRAEVAIRQQIINETQYQLFEHDEAHQELAEVDGLVEQMVAEASVDKNKSTAMLKAAARELVDRKRDYLDDLVRSNGKYFDALIELDTVDRQIISLEADYQNYIDERVLWIRSGRPLTAGVNVEESDVWMLSPVKWAEAGTLLLRDVKQYAILYLFIFAAIGVLLFRGPSIRRAITSTGDAAKKSNCCSVGLTLRGLWLTFILSLGLPLLSAFFGWRLVQCAGSSEFTLAIGHGLKVVGLLWGCVELVRQLCRKNGVGESHFQWPAHATLSFRREVNLCTMIAIPFFFISSTLASSDGIHERSDIQRVAFILGMCAIAFCVFRLLRPAGLLREYYSMNETGMVAKLKLVIPFVGFAVPISLGTLAAAGYFFTAQTLFWRLFATFTFVAVMFVLRSIFFRMLFLRRRQLSIEETRSRAAEARLASDTVADPLLVAGIVLGDKQADITAHTLQSRKLVNSGMSALALVGLWLIWIQVLPALGMIGDHPVWGRAPETSAVAAVARPAMSPMVATGSTPNNAATMVQPEENDVSSSVTLSDLAFATLIVLVTIVLFRNGPGLLEMSVLQQLPMEASVRYAITTLVSYAIAMFGTIAACSTIGLEWSQIQWLATALTFGLAFGLQEIFANFVAGLIILLERPVRVGDVVTVDEITGVVSRIRIRATSITNWDRKEYVVPNKEFITGKLLNWTLSDKVNRVVVEVGLAYGSDTEQARQLLLQVAKEHPVVLEDPPAVAGFEGFGDNSLNLCLRAFLPTMENRLQVIHDLHTSIDQAFRNANLEIAFPQRDLHIRSVDQNAAFVAQRFEVQSNDDLQDAA